MFSGSIPRRQALLMALAGPAVWAAAPAWAQTGGGALRPPTGKVILEIRGSVGARNATGAAVFDASMLALLPQHSITTHTPWFDQAMTFSGPLLRDVLDAAKATGTQLTMRALNDYAVVIPMSDLETYHPVVSMQLNGRPMGVRDKGPLFVMYPYDQFPELRNDTYYGRAIWQLTSISVQ